MHLLLKERRGLDEAEAAVDLGQRPADLLFLSVFDADLGAAAQAWRDGALAETLGEAPPSLGLTPLSRLRHPLSADLFLEGTAAGAKAVVARLHGGLEDWAYGAEELSALCRAQAIPLALVAGRAGGRLDTRLSHLSTAPLDAIAAFDGYLREGGGVNLGHALRLAAALARGAPASIAPPPEPTPEAGLFRRAPEDGRPLATLVFYRSHFLSGDTEPVEALAAALEARGMRAEAWYVSSLKSPAVAPVIAERLSETRPAVVVNLTSFSARGAEGSPLDAADAPVLQAVLSGSAREAWAASSRGLSPSDLAMSVALPELDGRLLTTAVAFKAPAERIEALQYERVVHRADPAQVALAADRALGWARLAGTARSARRLAIVLSDYPGAPGTVGQVGHAIGLDTFASLDAIAAHLGAEGYDIGDGVDAGRLKALTPSPVLDLALYRRLIEALPAGLRERIEAAWGPAEDDPCVRDSGFALPVIQAGGLTVLVQPDRGRAQDRKASYHDPDQPPRHGYVAAYLWLRHILDVHAAIHLGAHGTLEWLPGKAAAPAFDDAPSALLAGLPVLYPYVVNNPGEAAAAKRRLGAVTLGHLTPPLRSAGVQGAAAEVERLIDEYAAADGMDRRRTTLLKREILERAGAAGLLAESGCEAAEDEDDALARLDAYLCDVKDLQVRDGLHVYGQPPSPDARQRLLQGLQASAPGADPADLARRLDASAAGERRALLRALDGRFTPPGPAGAPSRGRPDVLPTGRNLFALDPRATPTRTAMTLAAKAADALLQRHLQDQGEWPRSLLIDLWGGPALRTGGEDLGLAFTLMGVRPVWDDGSNRVSGIEVTPLALLGRPRVDVTLRISGLFRDAFPLQIALFDLAVRTLAARDESEEDNPLRQAVREAGGGIGASPPRVFGPAPGLYGAGVEEALQLGRFEDRGALGDAYLDAGSFAYGAGLEGAPDRTAFAGQVRCAEALVHVQDHAEVDILDGVDVASFAGGFAAAAAQLGADPALYHADTSRPEAPRVRTTAEEVSRVVRGRAANPLWIAGQMRHGYRGAAEIARSADALFGFAATLPTRLDAQFDLLFDATLGDPEVHAFLQRENPAARSALAERLRQARARDLWRPRRNSVAATLEGAG